MFPDDLLYTEDHEWIRDDGGEYTVGVTAYVAERLGDITFVELPELGNDVVKGEAVAIVESVKAAIDVYAPVTGHVSEVNETLEAKPEHINQDPYGEGWIFLLEDIKVSELKKLMNHDQYAAYVEKARETEESDV